MKHVRKQPIVFNSISELHRALGLPKPLHPLISLVDYSTITVDTAELEKGMLFNFYKISYKKDFGGKIKYGQSHYDFDEGGLSFVSPNQVITALEGEADYGGYTLLVHPEFISSYTLGKSIKNYGFFSYGVNEALYLSEKEKQVIVGLFKNIEMELDSAIDQISQDVLVSQIELLLNYSKRYYNRQFITRKSASNDLLVRFEGLLAEYFDSGKPLANGLPAVDELAASLNVSAHYLSDMLRSLTGQNTQQHIHAKLIEKAKELLSASELSVAEVAYQLGFEHPQSFNRLFKSKTKVSPLNFRQSLN
ncbi:helix-turn-helix domain-containing protein [Mucilaginibacter aquaedulcis]|uniref:helix-turn-helix domain-containing protein n=1 Tax=Mucilaginibacter aquaedulcis TaxID=1187081 RepID=UPI0025B5DECD|nr:helix-turn-helix transcriptional regulator [Mucilaginibacter aquaedulcis]MDN3550043.1 helix-turn-helix transcriptional regulator [Mucilaginibacter aquaedulcis]